MTIHIAANDLLSPEVKRNPSTFYASLREQEPLSPFNFFDGRRAWIVTTYDDCNAILKDPRFIKDRQKVSPQEDGQTSPGENSSLAGRRDLLSVDSPDHTRLRHLVSQVFTPRMVEQWRLRIQQITDELLDAVQEKGHMDLIADVAFPLPMRVISEMLGIPVQDHQQFRRWIQTITLTPEGAEQARASASAEKAFVHYIKRLLTEKHAPPSLDLISNLLRVKDQGDAFSEQELISMIWLLISAGHETTVGLLGNGTLALLQHPDQLHLLQHDPSLISSTVEELLRYTAPVSVSSPRWASEDISLHGKMIRKDELVFLSLSAANTDPQQFTDPDVLDIMRQVNRHLAFGKGIHVCLGAPLARLEGQIAFNTLLKRLPHLRLAIDPEQLLWNRHFALRNLTTLPVTF